MIGGDARSLRQHYLDRAHKYTERADEVSSTALREYYEGRAAEARAVADDLNKIVARQSTDQNLTFTHEHADQDADQR